MSTHGNGKKIRDRFEKETRKINVVFAKEGGEAEMIWGKRAADK